MKPKEIKAWLCRNCLTVHEDKESATRCCKCHICGKVAITFRSTASALCEEHDKKRRLDLALSSLKRQLWEVLMKDEDSEKVFELVKSILKKRGD